MNNICVIGSDIIAIVVKKCKNCPWYNFFLRYISCRKYLHNSKKLGKVLLWNRDMNIFGYLVIAYTSNSLKGVKIMAIVAAETISVAF